MSSSIRRLFISLSLLLLSYTENVYSHIVFTNPAGGIGNQGIIYFLEIPHGCGPEGNLAAMTRTTGIEVNIPSIIPSILPEYKPPWNATVQNGIPAPQSACNYTATSPNQCTYTKVTWDGGLLPIGQYALLGLQLTLPQQLNLKIFFPTLQHCGNAIQPWNVTDGSDPLATAPSLTITQIAGATSG